jgi:hypothetical protein
MRARRIVCRRARLGNNNGGRLDRQERSRCTSPCCFDDRKGASRAQRFDQLGRRLLGDHDQRALKRHQSAREVYRICVTLDERC